jgi:hypothetical protein
MVWSVVILCAVAVVAYCAGMVVTLFVSALCGVRRDADNAAEIVPLAGGTPGACAVGQAPVLDEVEHSQLPGAEWDAAGQETLKIPAQTRAPRMADPAEPTLGSQVGIRKLPLASMYSQPTRGMLVITTLPGGEQHLARVSLRPLPKILFN